MYFVYHAYDLVMEVDKEVKVIREDLLPFDLRKGVVDYHKFIIWMSRRISNLQRTYMNKLYIQRRVGRSHDAIIADSAAISPVDLFWITKETFNHNWDSLQEKRDKSLIVKQASLDGEIASEFIFKKQEKLDYTSNFTTKGAFKKSIYNGYIVKKGDNAEYEISGYRIANHLNISCAQSHLQGDEVYCKLFTSNRYSMVHAMELFYHVDEEYSDDIHKKALEYFSEQKHIIKDLKYLYLLMYLVSNYDFHGENFGFLYDTRTFEIKNVAPAYDFNSAFMTDTNPEIFYPEILQILPSIVHKNLHLNRQLKTIGEILDKDEFLSEKSKETILIRADYLLQMN